MKKVIDSSGAVIGLFDGTTVKDELGKVVYWISGEEAFAPSSYSDANLQSFNKGQWGFIGKVSEGQCVYENEVVFEIVDGA